MLRRVVSCLSMLLLILGCLCGCASLKPTVATAEPSTMSTTTEKIVLGCVAEMIQIDGRLFYLVNPIEDGFEPEESQIAGYTTALVEEKPDADGECTFLPVGIAYAKWSTEIYPNTYIIQCPDSSGNLKWCLLRPMDDNE